MQENQEILLERNTIRELPNEVLLMIFSHLQTHDVKYNISNVCVRWSVLARDKKLWKDLNFKTTNKSSKTFGIGSWFSTLRFLESTPELQNVTISAGHSDDEVAELMKALDGCCPNLRHIDFDFDVALVVRHLKDLKNILENVESLRLTLGAPNSQGNLFKTLSEFKNLKKVAFVGANPESFGFRMFLRGSSYLQHVNVVAIELSKANFTTMWKVKDKFVSLGMRIDKLDENCLDLLSTFPKLKSLMLADGNSSPEKLRKVGKLECLISLHLQEAASSPVLTSSALTDFFQEGYFINLRELKLHQSRLNDEGAAEIRRKCINLIYLEVMTYPRSLSSLSEKALVHFLHCKSLRHFEILFDNSQEADWIYRRIRYVRHDCDIDKICPLGLEKLLDSWDEIQIPVD